MTSVCALWLVFGVWALAPHILARRGVLIVGRECVAYVCGCGVLRAPCRIRIRPVCWGVSARVPLVAFERF